MIAVRLFGICAAVFAVLGLFELGGREPPIDLYTHDGYYVIVHPHIVIAAAVVCGLFAVLYLGIARFVSMPMNRGLSWAHFVLIALPTAGLLTALYRIQPGSDSQSIVSTLRTFTIFARAWTVCFLVGCALFAFNLSWTVFRSILQRRKA